MKVLIHLKYSDLTGVGTFIYTIVSKLHKDVSFTVWMEHGTPSVLYTKLSVFCPVYFNKPTMTFDEIWTNYYTEEFKNEKARKKHFVHGTMNPLYKIPENTDHLFVFSERAFEDTSHNIPKTLIRNGVDIQRFRQIAPQDSLQKILIHDSRASTFSALMIMSVAQRLNAYTRYLGVDSLAGQKIWDTECIIKDCDMVVGYGRSLFEGMAMGKVCVCYGLNGGDGMVRDEETFRKMLRSNGSGWSIRNLPTPDKQAWKPILEELGKYKKSYGELARYLAEKYLDINLYLDKLLV